jgi:serine O-acetyltransferase
MSDSFIPPIKLRAMLRSDLQRHRPEGGRGAFFFALMMHPGFLAVVLYRLAHHVYVRGKIGKLFAKLLWRLNVFLNGCDISSVAIIGEGLHLPHPNGIVIGEVTIGKRAKILQHSVLGMRRFDDPDHNPLYYPVLGDDVTIAAGAAVLGAVRIGHHATVGCNAVVLHDVPEGALAVGNPARIILSSSSSEL